ncbi:MAG: LacI family DNA-binding transcriptional regulator [Spirochaetaceae bacterium]|jgi:LacI family transcriptional regulator|nr:LacI family DNA-binding transcriptional regulator [Spirochaetaceae bacterium]
MTLKEIAQLAGVSIGTIDRVIYHRGRVSPETKKNVEGIIERYQFTPDPIARRLQRKKDYRFCALLPLRHEDAGFWAQALAGIEDAAKTLAPLGIETKIVEYDRYNYESFKKTVDTALLQKPDGLIMAPIMPEKIKPFLDSLDGIPYVFFDADMPNTKPLCVIGHDPFTGGYLAGRLMHLFAGGIPPKPVAILDSHGEDYHLSRRREGFLRYAQEHKFQTVVMEYSGYQGLEISSGKVQRFLRENPALSGIFISNCMTFQVAEAAELAKRDFFIVGYDLIPNNHKLLKSGGIDAIISQHSEEQSRRALLTLYRHIVLEQEVPKRLEIPLDIYLKENAPQIIT